MVGKDEDGRNVLQNAPSVWRQFARPNKMYDWAELF